MGGWNKDIGLIQDINEGVESLLASHKCLGDKHSHVVPPSKLDLLANRLSPYQIKPEALSHIDICQNHLVSTVFNFSNQKCHDLILFRISSQTKVIISNKPAVGSQIARERLTGVSAKPSPAKFLPQLISISP